MNTNTNTDPIKTNQSKYRDADGVLRYAADDSAVFPGPTGVRRRPRPDSCPDCGASCRSHTGTYCHSCGFDLISGVAR